MVEITDEIACKEEKGQRRKYSSKFQARREKSCRSGVYLSAFRGCAANLPRVTLYSILTEAGQKLTELYIDLLGIVQGIIYKLSLRVGKKPLHLKA